MILSFVYFNIHEATHVLTKKLKMNDRIINVLGAQLLRKTRKVFRDFRSIIFVTIYEYSDDKTTGLILQFFEID